jgi:hypothetical protein
MKTGGLISMYVFPSLFIDVGMGWFLTYNFHPVSENETVGEINIYQLYVSTPSQKLSQEYAKILLRDVSYEDLLTMEGVQEGLDSGVLKTIQPGQFGITMRHQYWVVEQWVNAA